MIWYKTGKEPNKNYIVSKEMSTVPPPTYLSMQMEQATLEKQTVQKEGGRIATPFGGKPAPGREISLFHRKRESRAWWRRRKGSDNLFDILNEEKKNSGVLQRKELSEMSNGHHCQCRS